MSKKAEIPESNEIRNETGGWNLNLDSQNLTKDDLPSYITNKIFFSLKLKIDNFIQKTTPQITDFYLGGGGRRKIVITFSKVLS